MCRTGTVKMQRRSSTEKKNDAEEEHVPCSSTRILLLIDRYNRVNYFYILYESGYGIFSSFYIRKNTNSSKCW